MACCSFCKLGKKKKKSRKQTEACKQYGGRRVNVSETNVLAASVWYLGKEKC